MASFYTNRKSPSTSIPELRRQDDAAEQRLLCNRCQLMEGPVHGVVQRASRYAGFQLYHELGSYKRNFYPTHLTLHSCPLQETTTRRRRRARRARRRCRRAATTSCTSSPSSGKSSFPLSRPQVRTLTVVEKSVISAPRAPKGSSNFPHRPTFEQSFISTFNSTLEPLNGAGMVRGSP